ncbi:MAG: WD40 repeat domain-containing protein [Verrucomicrobia bacterium]|nr:WD40 repeat domain-containing protein [Verrucomicrobiota bacterium]
MSVTPTSLSTNTGSAAPQQAAAPQSSFLVKLPEDAYFKILGMLSMEQLGCLNQSCRQIYFFNGTDHSLTQILSQHFPNFKKADPNQTSMQALKEQYLTHSNLTKKVYSSATLLGGTHSSVRSLALDGQRLYSGRLDATIDIWDLNTNTRISTLGEHDSTVTCLVLEGQRLFAGANPIKIYDLNSNKCIATLEHENGCLGALAVDGQRLFASFINGVIEIWDLNTNTCTATLQKSNNDPVLSLATNGDTLFSGSETGTIKIWDLKTNTCTETLEGPGGPVRKLAVHGQTLYSGSQYKTIKIWDLKTNTCTATLQTYTDILRTMALDEQTLFSGSLKGTMRIWDLNTNTPIDFRQDLKNGHIFDLCWDGKKLVAGFDSGIIKIWNYHSSDEAIFKEIAELITSTDLLVWFDAMTRFKRMPAKAKNAIYDELYQIKAPFANDYPGCAEHAFHNQKGQSSTPEQRAQAILNYLAKRS